MAAFRVLRLRGWSDVREAIDILSRRLYLFRGHANASWSLESTLERQLRGRDYSQNAWAAEVNTLRRFKRRAHHYIAPPDGAQDIETVLDYGPDALDWVALLRHHGGPTRMLDATRSGYVATYFAFEERSDSDSALWAFSQTDLSGKTSEKWTKAGGLPLLDQTRFDFAKAAFNWRGPPSKQLMVAPSEPFRMNERMAAQQGLFLIPFAVSATFEENLFGTFDETPPKWSEIEAERYSGRLEDERGNIAPILKLVLPASVRREALVELERTNNTAASLYPGLDGFARSLAVRLTVE